MTAKKRLNLRERYQLATRDLAWEFSYQDPKKIYPYLEYEGIKVTDWDAWEDPFRLTMDAYWKYQAEKDKKLYAIIDAFAQNNGHLNITDARYVNALKLFLTGVSPLEYAACRGFAFAGRAFAAPGPQISAQMQSIDELRHVQTQLHAVSHYNKFFNGLHDPFHMHDRVWYLSVPKSFFEDAITAGPFEFLTAISFAFEYVLTNLLFMPFMSGAAYNGDMATVNFGFSAQSDESRHMTLGLEIVKFLLEQHEDNVPIVQRWMDKWFWRGYRLLALVAMMMDYILPKKIMSWKQAWEIYFEQNGGALFNDLARYGIRMPKYWEVSVKEKDRVSHEAWGIFYNYTHAADFHTWIPTDEEMEWFAEQYPDTFNRIYRPKYEFWRAQQAAGKRFYNPTLPQLCQTCQIPMGFTEPDDPTTICFRMSEYRGDVYHFCSDGCKDIFDAEPQKYVQAWLPPHQIYQGNCGGPTIPDVLAYYHYNVGRDNGEYLDSEDYRNWRKWKQENAVTELTEEALKAAS